MKNYAILIFFSIVSIIYFFVNYYVVSRGAKALGVSFFTPYYKWIYWILAFSFIIGQILERGEPTLIARIVTHIGSVWLAVFLYLLLFTIAVDFLNLLNNWLKIIDKPLSSVLTNGQMIFIAGWMFALSIAGAGWLNARYPTLKHVDIVVNKKVPGRDELTVVLGTDLHIGAMIGKKRIHEMVQKINSQSPDIVLFAGDLVDHNPRFVKAANIGPEFLSIQAPLGVFAVAGNHEFIGHAETSIEYLQQFGITYIRDTSVFVENTLTIIGRDDRERRQFDGVSRKSLDSVVHITYPELPVILMDHQPVEYAQVADYPVDLMVSGHTHKGQLWPFGYITSLIYENDFGLMQKGSTWFYTSSGYGTWGPPIRTGNRPELVVFHIRFQEK